MACQGTAQDLQGQAGPQVHQEKGEDAHPHQEDERGAELCSAGQEGLSLLPSVNNKTFSEVLTGVAQLVGCCSAKQKVAGSIPSQGTCLGCGFRPSSGHIQEATEQSFSLT